MLSNGVTDWGLIVSWVAASAPFTSYKLHHALLLHPPEAVTLPDLDPCPTLHGALHHLRSYADLAFSLIVRAPHSDPINAAHGFQAALLSKLPLLVTPQRFSTLLSWMAGAEFQDQGFVLWPTVHAVLCASMSVDSTAVQLWAAALGDHLHITHTHIDPTDTEEMARALHRAAALSEPGSPVRLAAKRSALSAPQPIQTQAVTVGTAIQMLDQTVWWLGAHPGYHHTAALCLANHLDKAALNTIAPLRVRLQHHIAHDEAVTRPLVDSLVALDILSSAELASMQPQLRRLLYGHCTEQEAADLHAALNQLREDPDAMVHCGWSQEDFLPVSADELVDLKWFIANGGTRGLVAVVKLLREPHLAAGVLQRVLDAVQGCLEVGDALLLQEVLGTLILVDRMAVLDQACLDAIKKCACHPVITVRALALRCLENHVSP